VASSAAPSSPSFAKPPLEEVALAIQFQPSALDLLGAADFRRQVESKFPRLEERPATPPMSEEFTVGPQPRIQFEVLASPPMSRLWFLSESGTRLLQLQADLIAYNWRKSPDGVVAGEPYPRYSKLRKELKQHLTTLDAVKTRDGEPLRPNWCEVTYINHIPPLKGGQRPPLNEMLRGVKTPSGGFLPKPEDANWALRFLIPGKDGPRGRLNAVLMAAVRAADEVPIWVLTLTARLRTEKETMAEALRALDTGHDWVVNGFTELTSDRMHRFWGRSS
jgi:uncharacterized protein (TIGR04255 family)